MKRFVAVTVLALFASVAALAHGGSHKKVMGTITKIDGQTLHIKAKDGHESHVSLTSNTKYVMSGKAAAMEDLKPGMRVVVNLATDGTAEQVQIGKPEVTVKVK